jgi:uncharacterized membrane protein
MNISLVLIAFILVISLPIMVYSFSPKETFTELYFNNPEGLPRIIKINETNNFSFTIISHEKALKNYNYFISSELISETNEITLAPGENITIARSIIAKETGEGNVTIRLDAHEIHFFYYIFE